MHVSFRVRKKRKGRCVYVDLFLGFFVSLPPLPCGAYLLCVTVVVVIAMFAFARISGLDMNALGIVGGKFCWVVYVDILVLQVEKTHSCWEKNHMFFFLFFFVVLKSLILELWYSKYIPRLVTFLKFNKNECLETE